MTKKGLIEARLSERECLSRTPQGEIESTIDYFVNLSIYKTPEQGELQSFYFHTKEEAQEFLDGLRVEKL